VALRLVVLVSGSGTNLQALLDATRTDPEFGGEVVVVASERADAGGLARAEAADVKLLVLEATTAGAPDPATLEDDRRRLAEMVKATMDSWRGRSVSPVYNLMPLQEPVRDYAAE
jgi:folate-dependent phosphoribosylglycinamide formyltransferase PurN